MTRLIFILSIINYFHTLSEIQFRCLPVAWSFSRIGLCVRDSKKRYVILSKFSPHKTKSEGKKHLIALMPKSNRSNFLICKSPDIQPCSFWCRSRVEFAQVHSVVSVPGEVTIGLFNFSSTFYCKPFQLPFNHTSYYIWNRVLREPLSSPIYSFILPKNPQLRWGVPPPLNGKSAKLFREIFA